MPLSDMMRMAACEKRRCRRKQRWSDVVFLKAELRNGSNKNCAMVMVIISSEDVRRQRSYSFENTGEPNKSGRSLAPGTAFAESFGRNNLLRHRVSVAS